MKEQANTQNVKFKDEHSKQKGAFKSRPHSDISQTSVHNETVKEYDKAQFEDTVEMFRNLITGDDHYHSRGSAFVQLFG